MSHALVISDAVLIDTFKHGKGYRLDMHLYLPERCGEQAGSEGLISRLRVGWGATIRRER